MASCKYKYNCSTQLVESDLKFHLNDYLMLIIQIKDMKIKKIITGVFIILLLIIVIYQFREIVTNPPITGDITEVPLEVKAIIKNSCYSCHSNETKLSFFNKLPFVAEMVEKDVKKGRDKVNFSEWDKYSEKEKKTMWYNILTKIKNNIMPPEKLFIHASRCEN